MESYQIFAGMIAVIVLAFNMLGTMVMDWFRSRLPKPNMFLERQDKQLTDLHVWHDAFEADGITPRWHKESGVQESLQSLIALLQSMMHDASTQAKYMQEANARNVKAFDQMFKLIRTSDDKSREHDAEMTEKVGIIMERLSGN